MKTKGDSIEEYKNALRKSDGTAAAANILYEKLKQIFLSEHISEDLKILCVADEIDNILCANITNFSEERSVTNG